MTGRSMLLASALVAVSGVWAGSASAAPIRADMSLQSDAVFEQVQMRGDRSGGNRGGSVGVNRSGGSVSINRSGGSNFAGNRTVRSGNWANNSGRGNSAGNWDGRRNSAWNGRRGGWRGPAVVFGVAPAYYDYGYYGYDDGAYASVSPGYVTPGVADDDAVAYCQQRFRSYDPRSGTYLGYDGLRHPCP